ncbi:hypothetical protein FDP41_008812 [Naegleria fowleri]|uniref:Replication termination factor 2 n=1 Tax=Naegleria fowleri TaxID=5763 RepID=A0A6A5BG13_NAEFO|nr:uncharacterized protein FDP41_008812 [Naegleria fowleri]KAF0972960.1 hypothetical protein FDP41_008812 [Naegleria fowleri]CAG4711994.1 unnamed protein product [Naegleria fowleri]
MGCDGGTIVQRRDLIVKTKKEEKKPDKESVNYAAWNLCRLTKEYLSEPIVVDKIGYLYNKTSLLECLVDKKQKKKHEAVIGHISKLSDLLEAKLEKNPNYVDEPSDDQTTIDKTSVTRSGTARFICPVTKEEIRGQFPVYIIKSCGHVINGEALDLAKKDGFCMLCEKPFHSESDVLRLNPEPEVANQLMEALKASSSNDKKRKQKSSSSKEEKQKKKQKEDTSSSGLVVPANANPEVYKSIFSSSSNE